VRIGVDLSPQDERLPAGVRRVFAGALGALRALAEGAGPHGAVELVALHPPERARRGAARAAWRQLGLPRAARAAGVDLLHSFVSAFPVAAGVPAVATVHELPWLRGEPENAGLGHRGWARLAAARAAAVCTPSRAAAGALGPRAVWLPWGLAPAFCAAPAAGAPLREHAEAEETEEMDTADVDEGAAERAEATEATEAAHVRRIEQRGPLVLCVGGGRPKKRLALLLQAVALAPTPLHVVVTGPVESGVRAAASAAEREGRVTFAGVVSDRALARLYRAARATAVLARSEGFGFPALEALASGTAVVCPAGSAQAEPAQGFAQTFAGGAEELAAALERAAPPGPAAVAYARGFTWARTAAELALLWRRVLDDRAPYLEPRRADR